MALTSGCCSSIDKSGRELVDHGTTVFPVACYQDNLSQMQVPWHWHPEWEAVRILCGSCIVSAGSREITLHAGQGFFINSEIIHSCQNSGDGGCQFHSVVFHPRLVGGIPESVFHQTYVQPITDNPGLDFLILSTEIPWQAQALEAIEQAWQQCVREPDGYEFSVRNALSELTLLLWQHAPVPHVSSEGGTARDGERIKSMLRFIHANFGSTLTVRSIAASISISESECLRCFRKTIHTTPIQYLKEYRITKAAQQLLDTQEKVSCIASCCGFQDMSYFTRAFRNQMGCTPTEYRERSAQKHPK